MVDHIDSDELVAPIATSSILDCMAADFQLKSERARSLVRMYLYLQSTPPPHRQNNRRPCEVARPGPKHLRWLRQLRHRASAVAVLRPDTGVTTTTPMSCGAGKGLAHRGGAPSGLRQCGHIGAHLLCNNIEYIRPSLDKLHSSSRFELLVCRIELLHSI